VKPTKTTTEEVGPSSTRCPVPLYYKCGGWDGGVPWAGCTVCVKGATCVVQNGMWRLIRPTSYVMKLIFDRMVLPVCSRRQPFKREPCRGRVIRVAFAHLVQRVLREFKHIYLLGHLQTGSIISPDNLHSSSTVATAAPFLRMNDGARYPTNLISHPCFPNKVITKAYFARRSMTRRTKRTWWGSSNTSLARPTMLINSHTNVIHTD
jgi:hypothetical protein